MADKNIGKSKFDTKSHKKYRDFRLTVDISCEEAQEIFNSVVKGETPSIDKFLAAHAHIVMCKKCLDEDLE